MLKTLDCEQKRRLFPFPCFRQKIRVVAKTCWITAAVKLNDKQNRCFAAGEVAVSVLTDVSFAASALVPAFPGWLLCVVVAAADEFCDAAAAGGTCCFAVDCLAFFQKQFICCCRGFGRQILVVNFVVSANIFRIRRGG